MRHFSGLLTSLWEERYDKRMDLALICLGKDVTPEETGTKRKGFTSKNFLQLFLKKSVSNTTGLVLVFSWDGGVYDQIAKPA
jgi:hypothetical protein